MARVNDSEVIKYMGSQLEEGKDHIKAIVVGEMGVGKSRVVNMLMGKNVAEEGGEPCPVTKETQDYERSEKYNGKEFKMTVVDTPGFGDPNKEDEFDGLYDDLKGCDLMVYCISTVGRRITREIVNILKNLNKLRGEELWKKTLFVFTRVDENKKFKHEEWEDRLKQCVPEIRESASFANSGDKEGIIFKAAAAVNKKAYMCWLYVTCGGGAGGTGFAFVAEILKTLLKNEKVCQFLSTLPIAEIATKVAAVLGPTTLVAFSLLGIGLGSIAAYYYYKKYYAVPKK